MVVCLERDIHRIANFNGGHRMADHRTTYEPLQDRNDPSAVDEQGSRQELPTS
jgi:hypothetical protein